MVAAVVILAFVLPLLLAGAFLLGRSWRACSSWQSAFSPVTRQHFEIFQTGHVNEAAVLSAKLRFQALLEEGDVATVEASLRPGMLYIFQIRALTEIGTESVGQILERQLQRRLSDDKLEQGWYWIDLAGGLRNLNREESLPQLLRCADSAVEIPLGHFFAAETVCFLGFGSYLRQPNSPLGRSALRLLHRALEGLRFGLQPVVVIEGRLGEVLESLWENVPQQGHPLLARIAQEICRFLRRAGHARQLLADERPEQEAFDWQISRLQGIETTLQDYITKARNLLPRRLMTAQERELPDLLQAIEDLRIEAAEQIIARVGSMGKRQREMAVAALGWSHDPRVAPWLRAECRRFLCPEKRGRKRRRTNPPRQSSVPDELPYAMILRALRGHPSIETERFLTIAARDWDPTFRVAALASLGWWEPFDHTVVRSTLDEGRRDPCFDVRQAARAALARLGERHALHWFRQGLSGEDAHYVHEAIQFIASEHLFMLWPDVDRLADSPNPELAYHAREALERLCEELDCSKR